MDALERLSAEINAPWEEQYRFRFEIIELSPVLVVTLGLGSQERFFVFGRSIKKSGELDHEWHRISTAEGLIDRSSLRTFVGISPLHRGPSQRARFLANFTYMGCAGSFGGAYFAYEWGQGFTFRSRIYNRPELVPVAKAIEFAQQRDFRALLGYCAREDIARKLVRVLPPYIFADSLRVTKTGTSKKRVEMGFETEYRFDVELLGGRWQIVNFQMR